MSKQGQEPFEFQLPFVPATPFRPIFPNPPAIHAGRQGNQEFQANCMGSEICSSGFTQESQTDREVACSDSTGSTKVNGGVTSLKAANLVGSACFSGDSNGQRQCSPNLSGRSNVSFADLLALANAASTSSSEGVNRHHGEHSSDCFLPVHVNLSAQKNIWIDGNCTPRKYQSKHKFNFLLFI